MLTLYGARPTLVVTGHPLRGKSDALMVACPCGVWHRRAVDAPAQLRCDGQVLVVTVDAEPFRPEWTHRRYNQDRIDARYALWATRRPAARAA